MTLSKSAYAILNVTPDADAGVIEAAYRALMKKYHPDKAPDAAIAEHRAAEINRAYGILRDPSRRNDYDASERARVDSIRQIAPPTPAAPRRSTSVLALVAVALVASTATFAATKWTELGTLGTRAMFAPTAASAPASAGYRAAARLNPVSELQIERAVSEFRRISAASGLIGLSSYSQDCFAAVSRTLRFEDLDFCVAFDQMASVSDQAAGGSYGLPQVPRFQSDALDARHTGAARLLADDDGWVDTRLGQIRTLALAALPAVVRPPIARARPVVVRATTPPARPRSTVVQRVQRREQLAGAIATSKRLQQAPAKRTRARDGEFLEREGYIY